MSELPPMEMETDRLAPGYQPDFDIDFRRGKEGELYVLKAIALLSNGRVEVKTDDVAARTKNVFVEMRCLRQDGWHDSGLATTTATLWVFVFEPDGGFIAVETDLLRMICRYPEVARGDCPRGSHPTEGYLVPVETILQAVLDRREGKWPPPLRPLDAYQQGLW